MVNKYMAKSLLKSRIFYLLLVSILMALLFVHFMEVISKQSDVNQVVFLENAIRRCAVQCYAIEGRFPDSIKYLEDNYKLYIDRRRYNVHYEYMGGNLIPQIWVFTITKRQGELRAHNPNFS